MRVRSADLVIRGRIATLRDPAGFGWVEAVAIGRGRILAAGPQAQVAGLVGDRTRQWRLGGHLLAMPSLCDAHLHLMDAALAAEQPDLTGLDLAGVADAIARRHQELAAVGDGGWLLGHGWSFPALDGRPHRDLLDQLAPGRPIALWAHDHHTRWLSSAALSAAGIVERADPPTGRIERDPAGMPTGILYEEAAGLVDAVIPAASSATIVSAIRSYARRLAELGVTSVHDPGSVAPDPSMHRGPVLYRALAAGGGLPLRVVASIREEQLERAIGSGFRSGHPSQGAIGRYRDGWLKVFSDGALGSRTASLLAPYEADDIAGPPPAGPTGLRVRSPEQLATLAARASRAGIACQIHAIGDAAVRSALDVLARVPPPVGVPHRIEHAQLIDEADVPRFAALGVAASVQPCHLLSDAAVARRAWGARTSSAFPLGDLDRAGALLPFGTDAPVEPPDPWPGIAAAVTRRGAGWLAGSEFHPRQAISLGRAMRAACLDGPTSAGLGDQGHLGVGARADVLIVPAGPFRRTDDADALASIRPLATLLDGEVVHYTANFDSG
jgi:predicted amidohydrolase YtcJ